MPSNKPLDEDWLASEFYRICARAAAIPALQRNRFINAEISALNVSDTFKNALENMMLTRETALTDSAGTWEKIAGFAFGITFVIVMLIIAIRFPNPSPFQYVVFRVVLSLAASGVGGVLSGFLTVVFGDASKPWLRAGGALAVFVVVFLVNPAALVTH
jgi:hypothetical protein